ncbi:MAG: TolC family protein [Aliarcobacter sp.]|nr:TolC family protein [Aliarcobacter sp.]
MKKIKLITISLAALFAVNVNALTLDEAVNIALKNNFDIESKNYDYIESLENIKLNNANYLPKLDASYGYTNTDEPNPTFESDEATAILKVSYNLFNGFKDMALKDSSKYLSQSSEFSLIGTKQDIVLDTKTAYINYLDKKNTLDTYNSAYKLI